MGRKKSRGKKRKPAMPEKLDVVSVVRANSRQEFSGLKSTRIRKSARLYRRSRRLPDAED